MSARQYLGMTVFVTGDARQLRLAAAAGLSPVNIFT
jgi:hypothetical protein